MNRLADIFTIAFALAGVVFFVAGTAGLLRFPDVHTRLHALTKADNLGLGLMIIAILPQTASIWLAAKLVVIWFLVLFASAAVSQLIARAALRRPASVFRSGRT